MSLREHAVLLEIAVFVPSEPNDDKIEHGEHEEEDGVREDVAIELIDDEEDEHDDGGRIRPKLVAEESGDQNYLDEAVGDEIERGEPAGLCEERGQRVLEVRGEEIVRVFDILVLDERHGEVHQNAWE